MARHWTFGQKIAAGFTASVALTVVVGAVGIYALRNVVAGKDRVIAVNAQGLIDAEKLRFVAEQEASMVRTFLLLREPRFLQDLEASRTTFDAELTGLQRRANTDEGQRIIEQIASAEVDLRRTADQVVSLRQKETAPDASIRAFEELLLPKRQAVNQQIDAFVSREQTLLTTAQQASTDHALAATVWLASILVLAALFAAAVAVLLTRTLARQIGTAVHHVQSSSAELQSAATQQATGTKEQATAVSEVTMTINELLATSRQIAESAQNVARIAAETAATARAGTGTVEGTQESMAAIRRQVDVVVDQILDLGKKSQEIGGVLDIVSELAEQTNILAINASIEAVGAGEAGKRFAIVADEIRKLADRVAGSAKDIRTLIEDVRGAVGRAVMATESSSKAVDSGSRQFEEVNSSFRQIAGLVTTTTEAAREIELSTKQQATAVEQINLAVTNVAQASRESEASSGQTLQTASQLATLSRDLMRLVQSQGSAAA